MQVLSLLPLVIGFGYFFGIQILITSGKDRQMFVSVCVGMVVSILLNFILIPFFNEIGAAYANIVSEVFVTIAYVYFVNKSFNFKIPYASVLEAVCSCISFIPIVIVLRAEFSNMILQVIFTVLSCSILYVIMQYFVFKSEISVMISKTIISKLKLNVYDSRLCNPVQSGF
jgi:O-antigen/teichoic acid export membrane protein